MSGPMGLVFPTPGASTDVWGITLDAMLSLVEQHDHTSGKGSLIPSLALGINADVSWASFALTAAKTVTFTEQAPASMTGYASALFASSADHNLYWRNSSGTNVQLTAGAAINVSAVGGIGGDYAAVSALFSYDDATRRYLAQQEGSPRPWAGLGVGDLDLYQKAASIVNKVTLKSPNALAASYAVTFPAALPAQASALYVDATGQVSMKPTMTMQINASAGVPLGATTAWTLAGGGAWVTSATSSVSLIIPVTLPARSTITGYRVAMNKASTSAIILTSTLGEYDPISHTFTQSTPGTGSEQNGVNSPGNIGLSATGLSYTLVTGTGKSWIVLVSNNGSFAGDTVYSLEVTYQPV